MRHFLKSLGSEGKLFFILFLIPSYMGRREDHSEFMCVCLIFWHATAMCSVQSLSHVRLFATPWTAAHQTSLSITNSRSLLKLISIKLVMPSNQLILCFPLLLLPSIFPSIRVFSSHQVAKYWSFSFSISPSNEYSGLISYRMDWFDLLAVQGTLKNLH